MIQKWHMAKLCGAISVAVLLPATALATFTDPRTDNEEIIVTGNKTTKAAIADIINITIARPAGGRFVGQHARLTAPVCPKIVGLSDENKRQVEKRMRGVALAAELKLAGEMCEPNILVMVVENGEDAISSLRQKRPRLFGNMTKYERARLAESDGPAYAWKRIQTGSAETGALQNSDQTTKITSNTEVPVMYSQVNSKVKRTIRMNVTHSFLLLEKEKLKDLTTVQIADYAAMRTLLDTRDGANKKIPVNSILTLFDQPDDDDLAPQSVSEMDLMLLSSLYHTISDVSASAQTSAMASRIASEISGKVKD
ncbi:hypothetical protein [Sphingorhabdus sp. Alg231-15]|uniref:hypothetical protein n=1 Tax=Sphingorhabdus sp. Alg231-15 TaxID=1922222 RepID=UPI000D55F1B8